MSRHISHPPPFLLAASSRGCYAGPARRRVARIPPPPSRRLPSSTPLRACRLHAVRVGRDPPVRLVCAEACRVRHRCRRASSRARPRCCSCVARCCDGKLFSGGGTCLGGARPPWRRRRCRRRSRSRRAGPLEDGGRSGSRTRRIDGHGALHHVLNSCWNRCWLGTI